MYLFLCSVQHAVQRRGIQVLHCFAHIPAEGIAGWKAAGCENRERRRIPGVKKGFLQQDVDVAPTLVLWSCSHLIYVRIFKIKHYLYPEQTHHEDARKKSLILLVIFNLFDAKFWINFIVLCLHVFPYWTHLQLSQFNPNESKMK